MHYSKIKHMLLGVLFCGILVACYDEVPYCDDTPLSPSVNSMADSIGVSIEFAYGIDCITYNVDTSSIVLTMDGTISINDKDTTVIGYPLVNYERSFSNNRISLLYLSYANSLINRNISHTLHLTFLDEADNTITTTMPIK